MPIVTHFARGVAASFVVLTAYTGTERMRVESLRARLQGFYATHAPPVPNEAKLDRLLSKHQYDATAIDASLREKYGHPLPPEDYATLFAEDTITAIAYTLRQRAALLGVKASAALQSAFPEGAASATETLASGRTGAASLFASLSKGWRALTVPQQLGRALLMGSVASLGAPTVLQLPVSILGFSGIAAVVSEGPAAVAPETLRAELTAAWEAGGPVERVALGSAALVVARALLGARQAQPCLLLWLLLAAGVTNPARDEPYEAMGFVDPLARKPLAELMAARKAAAAAAAAGRGGGGTQAEMLETHDLGVCSLITLSEASAGSGGKKAAAAASHGWESPIIAVGAFGQWRAVGSIRQHAEKKETLEVQGATLAAGLAPVLLLLLPLLVALTTAEARARSAAALDALASLALLALCSAAIAAAATLL